MKLGLFGAFLLLPSVALAGNAIDPAGTAPEYGFVGDTRADGMVMARQATPADDNVPISGISAGPNQSVALSRIIYLNHNGVTLAPGDNDSRTNKSTIVSQTTSIPAWNVSAADWQSTVSCFRD